MRTSNDIMFTTPKIWNVDSGCTVHITNDKEMLKNARKKITNIETANKTYMVATHVGDVVLRIKNKAGTIRNMTLKDVVYAPTATCNLMSVSRLLESNHRVVFDDDYCAVLNKDNGKKIVTRVKKHAFDFYHADFKPMKSESAMVADSAEGLTEPQLWHNRLCHFSEKYVQKAVPHINKDDRTSDRCEACIKGSMQKRPYNKKSQSHTSSATKYKFNGASDDEESRADSRLDKVKADTCQPFSDGTSTNNNRYFFLFVDVATRKKWIRFGRQKSDLKREFKDWLSQVENETGQRPLEFSPDGGGEFDNKELVSYLIARQRDTV